MARIIRGSTPRELGYRMPAEWERHSAIWLQWPGRHPAARGARDLSYQLELEKTWLMMAAEIHREAGLRILAQNDAMRSHLFATMNYFGFDMTRVAIYIADVIDVWHRDTGPVFVTNGAGDIAVTDWNFNGWGNYPDRAEAERHVPQTVAELLDLPVFVAPITTEGGALEVNGRGTLMATRSSIINPNRNPDLGQARIEQAFVDYLGIDHFIWLSGAPDEICERQLGDGTGYHIDIAARFVGRNRVLYAWTDDESDPRYPYLVRHLEELRAATDETGARLELEPLHLPAGGIHVIGRRHDPELGAGTDFTDASYLNYLVTNNLVLMPAFGNRNDRRAQAVLEKSFPGRRVVPIPAVSLNAEGGSIHCVTQQQPAV